MVRAALEAVSKHHDCQQISLVAVPLQCTLQQLVPHEAAATAPATYDGSNIIHRHENSHECCEPEL